MRSSVLCMVGAHFGSWLPVSRPGLSLLNWKKSKKWSWSLQPLDQAGARVPFWAVLLWEDGCCSHVQSKRPRLDCGNEDLRMSSKKEWRLEKNMSSRIWVRSLVDDGKPGKGGKVGMGFKHQRKLDARRRAEMGRTQPRRTDDSLRQFRVCSCFHSKMYHTSQHQVEGEIHGLGRECAGLK